MSKTRLPAAMLVGAAMSLAMPPMSAWGASARSPRPSRDPSGAVEKQTIFFDEQAFSPSSNPLSNPRRVFNYRRPLLSPEAIAWSLLPENRERLEEADFRASVRRAERMERKIIFRLRQAGLLHHYFK